MALNVNSALYSAKGIDAASVSSVSKQILNTPQVKSIDFSKFNRANQGIDLYSSRTDVELQRQIALTQAGLYVHSINVAKLNSNAAANLYSNSKVGVSQSTEDKHSGSSNGFNPFSKKEQEEPSEK